MKGWDGYVRRDFTTRSIMNVIKTIISSNFPYIKKYHLKEVGKLNEKKKYFKHSLEILCEELVYKQGTMIRIVTVCCFIGDGEKLADVGLDDDHCICIWNWKKEEKLATTRYV